MTITATLEAIAEDLSIAYPDRTTGRRWTALSGVGFELPAGGVLGVVGTAGSGKTTLGRILSGRRAEGRTAWPAIVGGTVQVAGLDLRHPDRAARRRIELEIGYLAQSSGDGLRGDLTVAENIAEPILSRERDFDRRSLGRAAALLIDAVDLPLGLLGRLPAELSRGQRQRVALAQALITEPRVLIVDEPAQGVDVIARPALYTLLERINAVRGCTLIVLSADLASVQRLSDRVLVLDRGFVVARGSIEQVLADDTHPYLRKLRQARERARAPLPGLVAPDALRAVERVAEGLFDEREPERSPAAQQLLARRPEFARFQQEDEQQ